MIKIKTYLSISLLMFVGFAKALTFQVVVLSDVADPNPGDGSCSFSMGFCSLRSAIMEANALGGSHTIELTSGTFELTLLGEESEAAAGDLNINSVDITIIGQGAEASIIDANNNNRIFTVSNEGQLNLSNVTLTGGRAATVSNYLGGAILVDGIDSSLNINRVNFINNSANSGGAIFALFSSDVVISESLFDGNEAEDLGFSSVLGGSMYCNRCNLVVDSSTFTQNVSPFETIGIHTGSLLMTNSTLYENQGGGISATNTDAIIMFSTLETESGNNLKHFVFDGVHEMLVGGSILFTPVGSSAQNCQFGSEPESLGYNIVSDTVCEFMSVGDLEDTDAMLQGLAENGGPTQTALPIQASPAIDRVPLGACLSATGSALLLDQRGEFRPDASACDVGSVEVDQDLIFAHGFE